MSDFRSQRATSARRRSIVRFAGAAALLAVSASACAPRLPAAPPEPVSGPSVVLLTSDGTPFARRGAFKDAPVDAATLPRHVVGAVLATEDRHFYDHPGVDIAGTVRAAAVNLKAGHVVQGGSTITQQLAKTYVGSERNLGRKLEELQVAMALERRLSKDQILSQYLNTVYFGDGIYGLRAAARHYFDKAPEDLSVAEAAMLAGVIKAPSNLAPTRHLEAARARSRVVLKVMAETGVITPEAAERTPLASVHSRDSLPIGARFADWVFPAADRLAQGRSGQVAVRTTLDRRLQARAEQVVAQVLAGPGRARGAHQAALVAMKTDGEVVAMVGGRDDAGGEFNRAVQAKRQPGSTFKLFVYLAALRQGATPDSYVEDSPIRVGNWTPENASGRYQGVLTLRDAFAESSNVAAVRIAETVGPQAVVRAAQDLGITSKLDPSPSIALGASEVSLLELTSAYASVAAGASPIHATGLAGERASPERALPEQGELLSLMRAVVDHGTGAGAALPIPAYGKTGTSSNNRDAWFVGFAGDLVVGVWVGNDDGTPMKGVSGGGLPAQIWRGFMETALADDIARARMAPPPPPFAEDPEAADSPSEPEGWGRRIADIFHWRPW